MTPEERVNETDIIRSVLNGKKDDFEYLVRKYHIKVISLCCSILHNQTDAEDAAQDIFVKAYKNLSKFLFKSSFSTWLYRITYHHCLDRLKAGKKHAADLLDESSQLPSPAPENDFTAEKQKALQKALSELPDDYRLILTLREMQGLSYEEIAQTMSVSLDSVKARLRRARNKLATLFQRSGV